MDNIIIPRLQFEVRYNFLLDFSNIIKKAATPFLRHAKSISYTNEGTFKEVLTINFEEDYHIDCRFDRMILLAEGLPEKFDKENSIPLAMFFDFFNKFSKFENFGSITNYLLLINLIQVSENSFDEILSDFKSKFINNLEIFPLKTNDVGVILEEINPEFEKNIMIGPFSDRDVKNRNLFPFKSEISESIKNKAGWIMEFKSFEKNNKINFTVYHKMFKESIESFKKFSKEING